MDILAFGSQRWMFKQATQANRSIIFTINTNGDISVNTILHLIMTDNAEWLDVYLTFSQWNAIGSVTQRQCAHSKCLYNTTSDYQLKENSC